MSTAVISSFELEDRQTAEVLADQVQQHLEAAFCSIVTAQGLVASLGRVAKPDFAEPEHKAEMKEELERLDCIRTLDVWDIEYAANAAARIRDLVDLHADKREDE